MDNAEDPKADHAKVGPTDRKVGHKEDRKEGHKVDHKANDPTDNSALREVDNPEEARIGQDNWIATRPRQGNRRGTMP